MKRRHLLFGGNKKGMENDFLGEVPSVGGAVFGGLAIFFRERKKRHSFSEKIFVDADER